jgi:hypothetical protein
MDCAHRTIRLTDGALIGDANEDAVWDSHANTTLQARALIMVMSFHLSNGLWIVLIIQLG